MSAIPGVPSFFGSLQAQPMTENQFPGNYNPNLGTLVSSTPIAMQQAQFAGFGGNQFLSLLSLVPGIGQGLSQLMNPTYSPMTYFAGQQQMAQMRQLQEQAWKRDNIEMTNRLTAVLGTTGNVNHAAAAKQFTDMYQWVYTNPMTKMLLAANPGVANFMERTLGLGTPQAVMAENLFYSTRHMGMDVGDVNTLTARLRGQMWSGNRYQPGFAQGLTGREASETYGEMFRRNLMGRDVSYVDRQGGDALKMVASYRDMFGPNTPVSEVMRNITQMTSGGLDSVSTGTLRTTLDKIETVAKNAGVSFDIMQALVTQGSRFARQVGLGGMAGVGLATSAVGAATAVDTATVGPYWGRWSPVERLNMTQTMMGQTMFSNAGLALAGVVRMSALNPGNAALAKLAGNITSGNISAIADPTLREAVLRGDRMAMSKAIAGMGVGMDSSAVASMLSDNFANSEYSSQTAAASQELLGRGYRDSFGRALSGQLARYGIRDAGVGSGIIQEMLSMSRRDGGADVNVSNTQRKEFMVDRLVTKHGMSRVAAQSAVEGFMAQQNIAYAGVGGVENIFNQYSTVGMKRVADRAAADQKEAAAKAVLTDAGIGRGSDLLTKLVSNLASGDKKDFAATVLNALGAPDDLTKLFKGIALDNPNTALTEIIGKSPTLQKLVGTYDAKTGTWSGGTIQKIDKLRAIASDPNESPARRAAAAKMLPVVVAESETLIKNNPEMAMLSSRERQQSGWTAARELLYASGHMDKEQLEIATKHANTLAALANLDPEKIKEMTGGDADKTKAALAASGEMRTFLEDKNNADIKQALGSGKTLSQEQLRRMKGFVQSSTRFAANTSLLVDDENFQGKSAQDVFEALVGDKGEGKRGKGTSDKVYYDAVFKGAKFDNAPDED